MRFVVATWLAACLALGSAHGGATTQPKATEPKAAEPKATEPRSFIYRQAGGQALRAFVFEPAASRVHTPSHAILLFHGGGWVAGQPEWTFPAARRFADAGVVAISIQYRLSGDTVTPIEALEDVCAAFAWARKESSSLGIQGKLAGYGVSAGGHLVAAAATLGCPGDSAAQRVGPDALLLWSPALDVAHDGWFQRILQGRGNGEGYSPADQVRASTPPTSIVHGEKDTLTPLAGSRRYCDRLTSLKGTCELHVYENVGHLLTRNLAHQESDFDPAPAAVADGIARHLTFLRKLGLAPEPVRTP